MPSTISKVLIIGAGPSGLTLATELTRRGIACSIVDKAVGPAPLHESRALAFNSRSQAILAPSGITEKILLAGHYVDRIRLCWEGQLRKEVPLLPGVSNLKYTKAPAHSNKQLTIIRQGTVERILITHLASLGVTIKWNTELMEFTQSESLVVGSLKTPTGTIEKFTTSTMVGCDGAHSQVRKQGGYSFDGQSDSQTWTLADATVSGLDVAHSITADLRPGMAFATMPIENSMVRLIHNGPDLLTHHPHAKFCSDIHWQSEFKVSYRSVKLFNRGRTFLCGDAAHIHSPVGGRGMNLGIEDAATLAWLLAESKESEYSAMRLPVAKKVLSLTQQQTSQMHSSSWISSLAKQYGPKILGVPFVRRRMVEAILGLDTPTPVWLK